MKPNNEIIIRLRQYVTNPFNKKNFPRCVAQRIKILQRYEKSNDTTGNEGFGML